MAVRRNSSGFNDGANQIHPQSPAFRVFDDRQLLDGNRSGVGNAVNGTKGKQTIYWWMFFGTDSWYEDINMSARWKSTDALTIFDEVNVLSTVHRIYFDRTEAHDPPNTVEEIAAFFNKRVPKVDDTVLTADYTVEESAASDDVDDSDDTATGDTDVSLIFQRDRVTLNALENQDADLQMLYSSGPMWLTKSDAERTSDTTGMVIDHTESFSFGSLARPPRPGMIIAAWTQPPLVSDTLHEVGSLMVPNDDLDDLLGAGIRFGAREGSSLPDRAALNQWRKAAVRIYVDANDDDHPRFDAVTDFSVRVRSSKLVIPHSITPMVLSPYQTPGASS